MLARKYIEHLPPPDFLFPSSAVSVLLCFPAIRRAEQKYYKWRPLNLCDSKRGYYLLPHY